MGQGRRAFEGLHRRAKDGHPEPFKMQYVEVGNEDWFDRSGSYDGRFAQFYDAIKKKYPQLQVISSWGYEQTHSLWIKSRTPYLVDEQTPRKLFRARRRSAA